MPITINDCVVCGKSPRIEIVFNRWGGYIEACCPFDPCVPIQGESFHRLVAEWNKRNPTPIEQVQEGLHKAEITPNPMLRWMAEKE